MQRVVAAGEPPPLIERVALDVVDGDGGGLLPAAPPAAGMEEIAAGVEDV